MAKRATPLLYIHQPKEIEPEAANQEFYYAKHVVVRKKKVSNDDSKIEQTSKSDERLQQIDDDHKHDQIKEEIEEKSERSYSERESNLLEKIERIQSYSTVVEPTIEVKVGEETYVGTLEKIKEGTVVLNTRKAPFTVTCSLSEIESIKVISL